jgi:hypothetical protein
MRHLLCAGKLAAKRLVAAVIRIGATAGSVHVFASSRRTWPHLLSARSSRLDAVGDCQFSGVLRISSRN